MKKIDVEICQKTKKIKKREYARNWSQNLIEEQKNKKREYRKNRYHMMIKAC